jgi:hypothetical protein
MKKLKFHFRTIFRKIYLPASLVFIIVALNNLIFKPETFKTDFDYCLGWAAFFVLIIVPNIALIYESIVDYKKQNG